MRKCYKITNVNVKIYNGNKYFSAVCEVEDIDSVIESSVNSVERSYHLLVKQTMSGLSLTILC